MVMLLIIHLFNLIDLIFFMLAIIIEAFINSTFLFGLFLHHKLRAAFGTGFGYGFVPDGEITSREFAASIKDLTPLGGSLHQFAAAAFLGAFYACGFAVGGCIG
jgi:hypothetical protein